MLEAKRIAPVLDIFPHTVSCKVTKKTVAEEVELLASMGFRRLYFVVTNPGFPTFSCPWLSLSPSGNPYQNYSMDTLLQAADLNFQYVYETKKRGLEAVAIFKPYEMGGGNTAPYGGDLILPRPRLRDTAGDRLNFSTVLENHPDWRVARRPYNKELSGQKVIRLEFAFCLDEIYHRVQARQVGIIPGTHLTTLLRSEPVLYTSDTGAMYRPYTGSMKVEEKVEKRFPLDANGTPLDEQLKRFLVVTISGFTVDAQFWAVSFGDSLPTIPDSMIRAYGPDGEIPVSISSYLRSSLNTAEHSAPTTERRWGTEYFPGVYESRTDEATAQMMHFGFEYGWHGSGFWGPGWKESAYYGFSRGKLEYMKGTPCEGYDGVRENWLGFVNELSAMGYDAVDLRLQNHSGMVADYAAYGYNEPIRQRYEEIYGHPMDQDSNPLDVMAVRGSFFLDFAAEAAELLHKKKKKLLLHLRHCHEEPVPKGEHHVLSDFNQLGFWAMPKVLLDWRRAVDIADEITIKDYFHNEYDATRALATREYAHSQGKPVWMHCYIAQGSELNPEFCEQFCRDSNADGLLLYEVSHSTDTPENNAGFIWLNNNDGSVSLHQPTAAQIQDLMERFHLRG